MRSAGKNSLTWTQDIQGGREEVCESERETVTRIENLKRTFNQNASQQSYLKRKNLFWWPTPHDPNKVLANLKTEFIKKDQGTEQCSLAVWL